MKKITLKLLLATEKLFGYFEKLNLIKKLKFSKDVLFLKNKDGSVELFTKHQVNILAINLSMYQKSQ